MTDRAVPDCPARLRWGFPRRAWPAVLTLVAACTTPAAVPFTPAVACVGVAGSVVCQGTMALTCDGRGHALGAVDCAPMGLACTPVGCRVCAPGATACGPDGLSPRTCRHDGTAWDNAPRCDPAVGEVCSDGGCLRACEAIQAHRETRGCAFWSTQTLNSSLGRIYPGTTRDAFPFSVAVSNPWPSPVHVTLSGGGLTVPVTQDLAAHGSAVLTAPWQPALVDAGDPVHRATAVVPGGALRLVASAPVAAYQFNPLRFTSSAMCLDPSCDSFTNDASVLLPDQSLGVHHVVVAMPTQRILRPGTTAWSVTPGFVAVVGTAPNTVVTLHLTAATTGGEPLGPHAAGDTVTVTLGPGDVLQLLSPVTDTCLRDTLDPVNDTRFCDPVGTEDLTGTVISATAPVAVFSGHDCAFVPYARYACDHLEESMPPVESLGTRYVVTRAVPAYPMRHADHAEGEPTAARIVAAHDGTDVTFDPPTVHAGVRLDQGQSVTLESSQDYTVNASQAVLVASMLVGSEYFPQDLVSAPSDLGDPALAVETPVDQYRAMHDFLVAPDFTASFANVIAPRGASVLLDGIAVDPSLASTTTARDVYRLPVSPGAHHLAGSNPMDRLGLRVYGYAPYTAYMYPGGYDLETLSPPQ